MNGKVDYEAAAYIDAYEILKQLEPDQILHWLARAASQAMPYRPTWSEMVRTAGLLAGLDAIRPAAPVVDGEAPF